MIHFYTSNVINYIHSTASVKIKSKIPTKVVLIAENRIFPTWGFLFVCLLCRAVVSFMASFHSLLRHQVVWVCSYKSEWVPMSCVSPSVLIFFYFLFFLPFVLFHIILLFIDFLLTHAQKEWATMQFPAALLDFPEDFWASSDQVASSSVTEFKSRYNLLSNKTTVCLWELQYNQ